MSVSNVFCCYLFFEEQIYALISFTIPWQLYKEPQQNSGDTLQKNTQHYDLYMKVKIAIECFGYECEIVTFGCLSFVMLSEGMPKIQKLMSAINHLNLHLDVD